MSRVKLEIPGEPIAKGRPRMTRTGHAFTPRKTRDYERDISVLARQTMAGRKPFQGPLALTILIELPIPSSWPEWKRLEAAAGNVVPCGRPDADNFLKGALDGLNGIVWADDAQVTDLLATKRYSETPRMVVEVVDLKHKISSRITRNPNK